MSHYNIDYSDLAGSQKQQKALADIIDWFGSDRRFAELTTAFREEPGLTQERFALFTSIAGVQGYPVIAWWNHCFPKRPWRDAPEAQIINLEVARKERQS